MREARSDTIRAGQQAITGQYSASNTMDYSGTFCTPRSPEDAFDLLADPQRFAPMLPFFESMAVQDATHFTLRIAIAVGQINGHANLAMELRDAVRPSHIEYRGQGIVAGSQLSLMLRFQVTGSPEPTQVSWRGELALDGMLALMAGHLLEPMGRKNFDLMAERLENGLREKVADEAATAPSSPETDNANPDSHPPD